MKRITSLFFILVVSINSFADNFQFWSDKLSSVIAKGKEKTILTGNARMLSDHTLITAQRMEIYGADYRFALCTGNITLKDEEKNITLTCEKLFYDRTKNIQRAEGNVVMEDMENELIVKGDFLENLVDEDVATIQIGVRILKTDMVARCEYARYLRDKKLLELSGMPVIHLKGDQYQAERIIFNLDTEEITLEGEVSGELKTKEKKEEPAAELNQNPPKEQDADKKK